MINSAMDDLFIDNIIKESENIDLYHRTTPEAAEAIYQGSPMRSKENTGETFWSNRRDSDSQATGYGDGIVHIRIPEEIAEIDDEFPDGEEHYRVHPKNLRPEHFIKDSKTNSESSVHTGAMVALIPSDDFIDQVAINGYEPPEQLHVTLLYLGEALEWSDYEQEQLREFIANNFINISQVYAEINATAVFNPQSDESASVYLIGGDGALACEEFNKQIISEIESGKYIVEIPDDHPFYLPHLTIGYNLDINKLTYTGPIIFNKIRVVFGGDSTDIPLRIWGINND